MLSSVAESTMSDIPSVFSKPVNDAPWWVVPILTFFCGVAVTAALLMPSKSMPDYQRGHVDGHKAGFATAAEQWDVMFQHGVAKGRAECAAK